MPRCRLPPACLRPLANAAADLGLSVEAGAQYTAGHGSETIVEALDALRLVDEDWYFLALENGIVDTDHVIAVAAWVATQVRQLALDYRPSRGAEGGRVYELRCRSGRAGL